MLLSICGLVVFSLEPNLEASSSDLGLWCTVMSRVVTLRCNPFVCFQLKLVVRGRILSDVLVKL